MKNSVGKMVTVQDGRPPVFDNYLIPPGEITLCATLRTDGYYYATSRECGNFKMCFVCSAPTEQVYTLKGTCRMSWFSFNYYLETTMDGKIQAFMNHGLSFSRKKGALYFHGLKLNFLKRIFYLSRKFILLMTNC